MRKKIQNLKAFKFLLLGILVCISTLSCSKNKKDSVKITGTIQKQGITTYQYGTHTISGYALRSSVVELDDYVNLQTTAIGHKIDGYPVDSGPDYIEVESVE